jgi:hypothetical protein
MRSVGQNLARRISTPAALRRWGPRTRRDHENQTNVVASATTEPAVEAESISTVTTLRTFIRESFPALKGRAKINRRPATDTTPAALMSTALIFA